MSSPGDDAPSAAAVAPASPGADRSPQARAGAIGVAMPDAGPPNAVDREIASLAGALVGRIFTHYQARAAELSLSLPEAKALGALEPGRPLSMRELAARVH